MKPNLHPELNEICFIDIPTGQQFMIQAAMRAKSKERIEGKEVYVVRREVTSASHQYYNNASKRAASYVDSQVKKFEEKFTRRPAPAAKAR
jgi:ribosomal protein L31